MPSRRAGWYAATGMCLALTGPPAQAAPTFAEVRNHYQSSEGLLVDRRGELLHELRVDPRRAASTGPASMTSRRPCVRRFIRAEDQRFADHAGVDWRALFGSWVSEATRRWAHELGEAAGVEIDFPRPFCGFKPPPDSVLGAFRRHFRIGSPEVELEVKEGTITRAEVKAAAACGSTYYIARWLIGRSLEDDLVTEVISKRLHSFPCTASMERDPELGDDTPLHIAGKAHNMILAKVKNIPPPLTDKVLSPHGTWLPKAPSPTDTLKNIAPAKEIIMESVQSTGTYKLNEVRAKRRISIPLPSSLPRSCSRRKASCANSDMGRNPQAFGQPVSMHGMGRVAKIGDSVSLAESILEVLNEPQKFQGDIESIKKSYDPDSTATEYEKLFERLMKKGR